MIDTDVDDDSITVLLCSDDAFARAAESHLTAEWGDAVVLTATTHEDAIGLLGDGEVDCVVYDDAFADDGAAFATRIRAEYPDLPLVLLTNGAPIADDLEVVAGGHTDVIWRREGSAMLDELAARIATVVATARSDVAGGRGRHEQERADERQSANQDDGHEPEARAVEHQQPDEADKIEALHEAATDIVTCRSEADVYDQTVAAAERILEFDVCCTMIYDDGMLVPEAMSSGAPPDGARPMRPDEGEAGTVYQTGEPRYTVDTSEKDATEPAKDSYRSGMSVPIGDVGVFQAVSNEPGEFSEVDVELAELLLSHTEAALDRIRFDEALQEEHERYRSLFELTTDCISESTLEGDRAIVRQVNPAFEEVFGYDADEIVGEELDDFVTPPSKLDEGYELNRRSVELGRFEREVTRETADGRREFLLRSVPFEIGDELRCFAVYTDITERKERLRILEELPATARELRDADSEDEVAEITVDTARNVLGLPITGIWLYDTDEDVLRPTAQTKESGELFGDHPTLTPEEESLCWEAFESGTFRIYDDVSEEPHVYNPETAVRSEMIFPLGRYGVVDIGSSEQERFTDVDVYFARILAATAESALERLDHEETLRHQQRELRRQNERLDEFASVVSHDLRNPLNVARGYADLAEDADSVEEAAGFAAEMGASLDRMETLVEDVLALARQGRTIRDPEPVALRDATELAWGNVETGDADLVVAEDATVLADESRLVQLLENLVGNAMEHGNADRLRVGPVRKADGVAGFFVEDDGPGIPPDRREQVFDLTFSTESEGAGLGLAIVEQIAAAHGWAVSVSESEAGGARFEFAGVEAE